MLPHLREGFRLLDVGSGPGTITVDLAERVAPGRVTALETSQEALDLTRAEAGRRGAASIDFAVGDVQNLDFASASFDVVHAHQVLQHVGDPVAALREMVRVCRPGGIVAVRDGDYGGFTWHPASPGLDSWLRLYDAAARANGGEPNAGRRLLSWAYAAGCGAVTSSSSTWCYASPQGRLEWGGMWAERIKKSAIADQLTTSGMATEVELDDIAAAWQEWSQAPDGWFSVLHGEILVRV